MNHHARIAAVAVIPFTTPRTSESNDVTGQPAASQALADAGISSGQEEQAYAGYVYGDSISGQRALHEVGMAGIPVVNVNNNCATRSTALWAARQAVESGAADCVLALGFEQMQRGKGAQHRPCVEDKAVAAVSLRPGHRLDARSIRRALAGIDRPARPDVVHVLDEIPVNSWYRPDMSAPGAAGLPPLRGQQVCTLNPRTGAYRAAGRTAA